MKVRASLGTLAQLGLRRVRVDEAPSTAYLLMEGRCSADCSFCPQARSSQRGKEWLSRVTWPLVTMDDFESADFSEMRRICLQTVLKPGWLEDALSLLAGLKKNPVLAGTPVSFSCRPASLAEAEQLFAAGIDRLGIPLDAAAARLYRPIKGGDYQSTYQLLLEVARDNPGRVSTHLIIGLGETETEVAKVLEELAASNIRVALFGFTPIKGTRLESQPPPELGVYRRMQVLRFMLENNIPYHLSFDRDGHISSFGYDLPELLSLLSSGIPFQTSGCPDCNRPYYNERPGQVFYNYPRPLTAAESVRAVQDLLG